MIVLLDTNVIVDALNLRRGMREFLFSLVLEGHILASCPITVAEVYAGMRPREESQTSAFLRRLRYYGMSETTAKHAGELKAAWSSKGVTLALADLLIAAVAIDEEIYLATQNRKHFPMPDLKLVSLPLSH